MLLIPVDSTTRRPAMAWTDRCSPDIDFAQRIACQTARISVRVRGLHSTFTTAPTAWWMEKTFHFRRCGEGPRCCCCCCCCLMPASQILFETAKTRRPASLICPELAQPPSLSNNPMPNRPSSIACSFCDAAPRRRFAMRHRFCRTLLQMSANRIFLC